MNKGYYVMGTHQAVAWFLSYLDAVHWVKQEKLLCATKYTIMPVNPPQ